ncbi:MAG: hypothetical protein EOO65_04820, partial [Methanosarcinales archaeon]
AFTLLIFFHTALFFSHWEWFLKNNVISYSLNYPLVFLIQWRMPLLFIISGAGVYWSLGKRSVETFIKDRTRRILLPLFFGMYGVRAGARARLTRGKCTNPPRVLSFARRTGTACTPHHSARFRASRSCCVQKPMHVALPRAPRDGEWMLSWGAVCASHDGVALTCVRGDQAMYPGSGTEHSGHASKSCWHNLYPQSRRAWPGLHHQPCMLLRARRVRFVSQIIAKKLLLACCPFAARSESHVIRPLAPSH